MTPTRGGPTSHTFADDSIWRRAQQLLVRNRRLARARREQSPQRVLARRPDRATGTVTSDRINRLLRRRDADYLEIGVWRGETFEAVAARRKVAVDPLAVIDVSRLPSGAEFHQLPSDDFFHGCDREFDAVLVDGLHESVQAYRDIRSALIHLKPDGFVLVDDVVPPDDCAARPSEEDARRCAEDSGRPWMAVWTGDVFRAVRSIADSASNIDFRTVVGGVGEHAQTLFWWSAYPRSRRERAACIPAELGESALSLEWSVEFRYGVPGWLRPATRKVAEAAFRVGTERQIGATPLGSQAAPGGGREA